MTTVPGFYSKTNNKYKPTSFFNIMRFVSIFIICCIYHVRKNITFYPDNPIVAFFQAPGKTCIFVEMFFVISGFLFFLVYFNRITSGKLKISDYLKKKLSVIYPIIVVTTLYLFLLYFINYNITGNIIEGEDLSPFRLMMSLLFGSPNSICNFPPGYNLPLWYLFSLMISVSVACLLTHIYMKHKNKHYICVFLIPIGIGILMYGCQRAEMPFVFWNEDIPHGFISFFIGFYLAMYIKKYEAYSQKKKNYIRLGLLIWLTFFLILVVQTNNDIPVLDLTLSFSIGFWPQFILLFYDVKWINKFANLRPIVILGYVSFLMYVLNFPVIKTIQVFDGFSFLQSLDGWMAILILGVIHLLVSFTWYLTEPKIRKSINKK